MRTADIDQPQIRNQATKATLVIIRLIKNMCGQVYLSEIVQAPATGHIWEFNGTSVKAGELQAEILGYIVSVPSKVPGHGFQARGGS